jgi:hypothetical protein
VSSDTRSAEVGAFRTFLDEIDLVDLPILGRRYTWYKLDGSTMSRIDRMFISHDWLLKCNNSALWALNHDVSDNSPLVLRSSNWIGDRNLLGSKIGG